MTSIQPTGEIDQRFSDPDAVPRPWPEIAAVLRSAELYWLTTVRADGRPHVTPLIGVEHEQAIHFCTGLGEQKARNLEQRPQVALTTGRNAWAEGLDVVVEGTAVRITDHHALLEIAEAYVGKYGETWRFEVADGVFDGGGGPAGVFRIAADKVLAFAKDPHGQATYRFDR